MAFLILAFIAGLPQLSVGAVFDILLLAFILYYVFQVLKGTRAPQILLGMAFLVALYYGARWSGLRTVEWMMDQVLPFLIFAFIVIFAAPLRNGLAMLGRNPFRPASRRGGCSRLPKTLSWRPAGFLLSIPAP